MRITYVLSISIDVREEYPIAQAAFLRVVSETARSLCTHATLISRYPPDIEATYCSDATGEINIDLFPTQESNTMGTDAAERAHYAAQAMELKR